jgi:hypothetical protein
MSNGLERIKAWFGRARQSAEQTAEGEEPAAVPPPGVDADRETSTNAQMEGATDEPWGGNS